VCLLFMYHSTIVSCCTCVSGVYVAIHDSKLFYMCVWCLCNTRHTCTTDYYRGLLHRQQTPHVQQLTVVDCYINTRHTCTTAYHSGLLHKQQTHMYKQSTIVSCCTFVSGVYVAIHDSKLLYMCICCLCNNPL
jgi:hypothetical protein